MGCSSAKSNQPLAVITKKKTITDRESMNPHQEDLEASELHPGRPEVRKETPGMDATSKLLPNNSKIALTDIGPLNNTYSVGTNMDIFGVEKNNNANSMSLMHNRSTEKVNFPNHEHKFDFEFLEDELKDQKRNDEMIVDDVLKELNHI